jgi:L-lactate dehydrogenase complex protein LldG
MTPMDPFLQHVAKSLGRATPPTSVPSPPVIDESITRLVSPGVDLVDRFIRSAQAAKLHVHPAEMSQLAAAVVGYLKKVNARSVVITACELFDSVGLIDAIRAADIDVVRWDQTTLDASYDVEVGITDVWRAVAETGSLVVKSSASHGRAVSLVPPYHVAVVRKSQIVPDLIDVLNDVQREGAGTGIVMITGPSKTADIEMNLVVGVHGPGEVEVFVVD